tara:strand:- start:37 stop:1236 length:1200 start_codon:yes stop_codon:yes gene_type:complete
MEKNMKQGNCSTLDNLSSVVRDQAATKLDVVMSTKKVAIHPKPIQLSEQFSGFRKMELLLEDGRTIEAKVDRVAQDQIASFCGKGFVSYARHLADNGKFDLLADNFNSWLHTPDTARENRMFRLIKTPYSVCDYTLRSMKSDMYLRLDNEFVLDTLRPVLDDFPELEVQSLNAGDHSLHAKFTSPQLRGEVEIGDIVEAGVRLWNNEIGLAFLWIQAYLGRLACTNGAVMADLIEGIKRMHRGPQLGVGILPQYYDDPATYTPLDIESLQSDMRSSIRRCLDQVSFDKMVAKLQDTASKETMLTRFSSPLIEKPEFPALTLVEKDFGSLTKTVKSSIHQHFVSDANHTQWGFANAITRTANDQQSYATATRLEEIGGNVLAFTPRQWSRYQNADYKIAA